MKVCHTRTLIKGITWRIVASVITAVLVFAVTGSFEIMAGFSVVDVALKFTGYYLHERGWDHIKWGVREDEPMSGRALASKAVAVAAVAK